MLRYIDALILEREPLMGEDVAVRLFSLQEGRLYALIRGNGKRTTLPSPPGLYTLEVKPKAPGFANILSWSLTKPFFQRHHLSLHHFCLPILNFYPLGEPCPFTFGRYLSALRRSTDEASARENALWFATSVLLREGLAPRHPLLVEFARKRKTPNPKAVWKLIREGLKSIEANG